MNRALRRLVDKTVKDGLLRLEAVEHDRRVAIDDFGSELQALRDEMTPADFRQVLVQVKDHPNVNVSELARALGISRARLYELIET